MCNCVSEVKLNRLVEQAKCLLVVVVRVTSEMDATAKKEVVVCKADCRLAKRLLMSGGFNPAKQGCDDRLRHLVLHREDVVYVPVVAFSPQMRAGRLDQL